MGDLQVCAVHGKNRAMRYLTEQGPGRFVCMVGYECKAAGSGAGNDLRVQCTLHGKLRSLDCLQDDGTGRLICTAERRCKTTGVSMPDYRDRDMPLGDQQLSLYGGPGGLPYGMPNPYAAFGANGAYGGMGAPQYCQANGAAASGQYPGAYGAYGPVPGIYPHYGGYSMFPPGVVWPCGAVPAGMPVPDRSSRSRSERGGGGRKGRGGGTRKRHSSGSGGRRRRRRSRSRTRSRSPSHYNTRRRSPSSSSSSSKSK